MPRPRKELVKHFRKSAGRREYRAVLYGSDGSRHRYWLDTADRKEAERCLALEKAQQARYRAELPDARERYLKEREPYLAESTRRIYRRALDLYHEYPGDHPRGFALFLKDEGYSDASTNIYLRAVKSYLRYLDRKEASHIQQIKIQPGPKRILTVEESDKLLEAAEGQLKAQIAILLYTGCRRGEMLSLAWDQIGPDSIRTRGKGRERIVPMLPPLQRILSSLPRDGEHLFPGTQNGHQWHTTFNKRFQEAVAKAGIPRCTPHDLRRTVATRLKERGASDKMIQALLGHVSIDTTYASYIEVSDDLRAATLALLEPSSIP